MSAAQETNHVGRRRHVAAALADRMRVKPQLPWPAIVYLMAVVIPFQVKLGPLFLTGLRGFLLVITIPLMLRILSGKYGRVFVTDILFILHILWVGLCLAINNPELVIQQTGSFGLEFLGGYAVGRAYIRTPEAFVALCKSLVVIVLCTLPFAVFETLTERPIIIETLGKVPGIKGIGIIDYQKRLGLDRVQVVFEHPIHYGLFCSIAFSCAFVALKGFGSTLSRYVKSALVAGCCFLSLSSGALLAIALQFGLILWAAMFRKQESRWWILVGLFVIGYIVVDLLSNRRPLDVFMSYMTFSAHNAYWRALTFEWGMKNVWASPIVGNGLNDWFRPDFMHTNSVDNYWLLMAMRFGIPGFAFLAVGYLLIIFHVMRRKFTSDMVLLQTRRTWVFIFLGLTFTLTTVHVWTNLYSFVFFMFGAGVWLITVSERTTSPPGKETADVQQWGPTFSRTAQSPVQTAENRRQYSRFPARKRSQK